MQFCWRNYETTQLTSQHIFEDTSFRPGSICNDLSISDVKINLSWIFQNFQNGGHFDFLIFQFGGTMGMTPVQVPLWCPIIRMLIRSFNHQGRVQSGYNYFDQMKASPEHISILMCQSNC